MCQNTTLHGVTQFENTYFHLQIEAIMQKILYYVDYGLWIVINHPLSSCQSRQIRFLEAVFQLGRILEHHH